MAEERRKPENIALGVLMRRAGWNRQDLASAAESKPNRITELVHGGRPCSRRRLEELAGHMGFPPAVVAEALAFVGKSDPAVRRESPGADIAMADAGFEAILAQSTQVLEWFLRKLLGLYSAGVEAVTDRQEARLLWATLSRYSAAERRFIVQKSSEYRLWSLAELICHESIRAAADDASRALELAELARLIADLVPGEDVWRWRLQGYVWAHIANAKQVQGELPTADWSFDRAKGFWQKGKMGDPRRLLEEARVLGMESALRKEQRRLPEALALIESAIEAQPSPQLLPLLLVGKANVLELQGKYDAAILTLEQVSPRRASADDARLRFAQRFGLASNLCHLSREQEASQLLPEIRRLTGEIGNALDSCRLRWLEGRIAAGLGRRQQAIGALSTVRQEFADRSMAYDTALATLELATLYLEEGRTAEVKKLAREMAPIFKSQGVHPEALAALQLFTTAALQERATTEWARSLVRYLYRAQGDLTLRFELPA